MNKVLMYCLKYWNGNLVLSHAFLHVYVPLTIASYVARALNNYAVDTGLSVGSALSLILFILWFLVAIYKCVGLWRCATNTGTAVYKYLSRVIAVFPFAVTLLLIVFFRMS